MLARITLVAGMLGMLALGAIGCGTTVQYAATNAPIRAMRARPPETVRVFSSGVPNVPYTEVGILQARQSSTWSVDQMPEIIEEMRARAAEIGCDGILITSRADKTTLYADPHHIHMGTREGYQGACIQFIDPSVAQ